MHRVYIETSVISYLTARPSRDLVVAGHQQLTRNWWDRRARVELFVFGAVLQEAMRGDTAAAKERAEALEGVPVLTVHPAAESLATSFIAEAALPEGGH